MKYLIINILLLGAGSVAGQEALTYRAFMERVKQHNIGYAAEQMNISVAEAELQAAHVFNDPSVGVEYADNDDRRMQMGRSVSVELSKSFSLGKRGANIALARSEKELNAALLEDYFHSLRLEATVAYLDALKSKELYRIKEDAYKDMLQLAASDSLRHSLGEITQVDATQSRLEAGMLYNELLQARANADNAVAGLAVWTGRENLTGLQQNLTGLQDLLGLDGTNLSGLSAARLFSLETLLQTAIANRADLAAALKNVDVATKQLKVVKSERNLDFDLALGYNYNTEVRNEIAPAPQFNGVTLGVSIPLKFSNLNKGALKAAELRIRQAELNYEQAEIEIRTAVVQSHNQYTALLAQVRHFDKGLLQQAKEIIDGKTYSYHRGETSLHELLEARRTYDDLRATYAETLTETFAALARLERQAAIWDIDF
jgi:cobalt-zinc-cadmium efflux system outer membrane protein